jgi:HK97 gp10 family phage protein
MPGRTGAFSFSVKGDKELVAALGRVSKRMSKSWVRGAVAEGANVIRDQVKDNAIRQGLNVSGYYPTTPGGRNIDHRGMIPMAVRSWVEKQPSSGHASAGIRIVSGRRRSPTQTYHWHFVEFGGPNNPVTRPFWTPALNQSRDKAMAAAREVILRQIANANSGKV